ncbi:hypothetical protein [Methanobacterium spitsbergense]|uniref:Uncharacterized protein n=1 Tax=Methanobacterium spitsbergense TaxID=2874285 RepID=A0A8T5V0D8_9EURY|nr:hypothetical protein [Methanobacterium spitsbergense]MBZ2166449.1 hypothetical protein [Methanobacterium spitsbergense]
MTIELVFLNRLIISAAILIGIANVGLLSALFYFYWTSYNQLKSKFTTGLLYFALILLIQNILAIVGLAIFLVLGIEMHELGGTVVYAFLLSVTTAQLIALTILFIITWD